MHGQRFYTWWSSIDHPGCSYIVHTDLKQFNAIFVNSSFQIFMPSVTNIIFTKEFHIGKMNNILYCLFIIVMVGFYLDYSNNTSSYLV